MSNIARRIGKLEKLMSVGKERKISECIVVFPDRGDNVFQTDFIFVQSRGVYTDLILKDMPANRKDICYARDSLQLIFDDPVIYLTKICS